MYVCKARIVCHSNIYFVLNSYFVYVSMCVKCRCTYVAIMSTYTDMHCMYVSLYIFMVAHMSAFVAYIRGQTFVPVFMCLIFFFFSSFLCFAGFNYLQKRLKNLYQLFQDISLWE